MFHGTDAAPLTLLYIDFPQIQDERFIPTVLLKMLQISFRNSFCLSATWPAILEFRQGIWKDWIFCEALKVNDSMLIATVWFY